jgi:DNA-binding SARP family transcriptional activator/predicted negative regulator of RcsB-dependent stress response
MNEKVTYLPLFKVYQLGQFRLERQVRHEWQTVTNPLWQHRNVRMLLAYLLHSPGRRRGREQIIEELWPDQDIENAANRLNNTVHTIRQLLEPELARPALSRLLRLEADALILADANTIWSDTDVFISLSARAHGTSDAVQAEALIEEAVALYGGDFLQEERIPEWAQVRREVLQRMRIGLLLELADHRMSQGELSRAIDALHLILATDPTNEAAVRRLMLVLTQLDRRNEALHVYHKLTTALEENYGIAPLAETRKLFEAIRKGNISGWLAGKQFRGGGSREVATKYQTGETKSVRDVFPVGQRNWVQPGQIGRGHQSPLVGRTEELEILRKTMFVAEEGGETLPRDKRHFVLLRGETGIGKTRLAEELSREASKRGWSVAWSRSYEQESDIPYRLWTEILRKVIATLHGVENWQLFSETQQFGAASKPGAYDIRHLSMLLPELQQLLPQGTAPNSLRSAQEQLYIWEATYRFLAAISQKRPLLIILDDLHWADDSSLELLAYLIRHFHTQGNQHLLLVGTCRETELTQSHPLRSLISALQREQVIRTLDIQPLTQEQIGALVAPLPDTIVQHIQTQAAGNPFFAEELARYSYAELSTTSAAEGQQGIASSKAILLPETITAALDRRMSHLSNACQRLLGKAALLGGSFEFDLLQSMESSYATNYDEDMLLDQLDEALQAGVLTEESDGMHIVYHFWHPMIVSHLYAQLSVARRTQLHRRAALALQQLYKEREEEVAAAITQHLVKGSGSSRQITRYAEIAGNRAYALSAYPEAQHHYELAIAHGEAAKRSEGGTQNSELALTALQEEMHLAFLHERLGECLMVQGDYHEAYTHFEHVLKIRRQQTFETVAEQQREAQIQALLWYEMGCAHGHTSNLAGAQECNERGQEVLREAGVTSGVAWACLRLQYSNNCYDGGMYDEAREAAKESLRMFEDEIERRGADHMPGTMSNSTRILRTIEGDRSELGNIYETLGIIEGTTGQIQEALTYLNTALTIFEQQNNIRSMANVCNNIGMALMLKTAHASANSYFRRSLSLAERVGDFPLISTIYINLGELATLVGDLVEAEIWYRRSLKLAEKVNIRLDMCFVYCALTTNLQEQGKLSSSIEAVRHALALGREINSSPMIGLALITLATLRIMLVEEEQAARGVDAKDAVIQRRLRRIMGTLRHALMLTGLRAEDMARARLAQAYVFLQLGDKKTAGEIAKETMSTVEQQQHFQLLAQAQRLLGRILCAAGQYRKAEEYFELALQTSHEYGMRLEYARALSSLGEALLLQSCPTEARYQQGVSDLEEASSTFARHHATIELERVNRILPKNLHTFPGT